MDPSSLTDLADGLCAPPDGDYRALASGEVDSLLRLLPERWAIVDKQLQRVFPCRDYPQAAELTQQIAQMAESVNHHPQLVLEWCRVTVRINTHAVGGLALGDFVFAAKTELLAGALSRSIGAGAVDDAN
jgi:4a-hydroxytetrahydrobiopterin dehydratase